jgi:hypothetical protein
LRQTEPPGDLHPHRSRTHQPPDKLAGQLRRRVVENGLEEVSLCKLLHRASASAVRVERDKLHFALRQLRLCIHERRRRIAVHRCRHELVTRPAITCDRSPLCVNGACDEPGGLDEDRFGHVVDPHDVRDRVHDGGVGRVDEGRKCPRPRGERCN